MTNLNKLKDILSVVVSMASALVTLSELWNKIEPDVKRALKPVLDGCKKIAPSTTTSSPVVIEKQEA